MYPDEQNNEGNTTTRLDEIQRQDRGFNVLFRPVLKADGSIKTKRIVVYTSGGIGNRVRDAETGQYYSNRVGSKDEDLFFKVSLATGECRSANGSNALFYLSPMHFVNHLGYQVAQEAMDAWEQKRDARLHEIKQ